MKASGLKKLIFCLWVCLVAVASAAALLASGTATLAGSETSPPGEKVQDQPAEQIRPKVGFVLQKVGDRWEPERHYHELFRLPGTHLRFGSFTYLIPEDEEMGAPMFGFLRDDGRLFYVRETAASDDDAQYALSGNYFIVDGGAGGSGTCRSMYLFKYDKDSMRLLDKIEEPYGESRRPASFPTIQESRHTAMRSEQGTRTHQCG